MLFDFSQSASHKAMSTMSASFCIVGGVAGCFLRSKYLSGICRGTGQLCYLEVGLDNPHRSLPTVDILQFWNGRCVWNTKIFLPKNKVICINRWITLLKLKTRFLRTQTSGISVHRTQSRMEKGWCVRKENPFLFGALRTESTESHSVQFLSWWQQYVSELWVCVDVSLRSGRQAAVGLS